MTIKSAHFSVFDLPIPWWAALIITVVFILTVCALRGKYISKNTYVCPICGHRFKKKWYHLMLSMQIDSDTLLTCPNCKKRDWCKEIDDV